MAHDEGSAVGDESLYAAVEPEVDLGLVMVCVYVKGNVGFGWWWLGCRLAGTYVASTDTHISDTDDHVEGIFDCGNGSVLETSISGTVEET